MWNPVNTNTFDQHTINRYCDAMLYLSIIIPFQIQEAIVFVFAFKMKMVHQQMKYLDDETMDVSLIVNRLERTNRLLIYFTASYMVILIALTITKYIFLFSPETET